MNLGADPRRGGGSIGSALHIAVSKLHIGLVSELINKGANVDAWDSNKNTPLHILFTIWGQDTKKSSVIATLLLSRGANPNTFNKDLWKPIHLGIQMNQVDSIKWVL